MVRISGTCRIYDNGNGRRLLLTEICCRSGAFEDEWLKCAYFTVLLQTSGEDSIRTQTTPWGDASNVVMADDEAEAANQGAPSKQCLLGCKGDQRALESISQSEE